MGLAGPVAKIIGVLRAAVTRPVQTTEKVVGKATEVAGSGVRAVTNVVHPSEDRPAAESGTADHRSPEAKSSPVPGPDTAPPAMPEKSIEELAEAAVAREMAEEPLDEPARPAGSTAPPKPKKPRKATQASDADGEPLIDSATANAVKSETDTLRAAADVDKEA